MTRLDRTISHMKTRAKKSLANKKYKKELTTQERCLSNKDLRLLISAAEQLESKRKKGKWKKWNNKPRCAAFEWNREGLKQCKRAPGITGYCHIHKSKRKRETS